MAEPNFTNDCSVLRITTEYMEDSKEIDWLRITLTPENREFVLKNLRAIHVPGEVLADCVIVYGHRMDVDYI